MFADSNLEEVKIRTFTPLKYRVMLWLLAGLLFISCFMAASPARGFYLVAVICTAFAAIAVAAVSFMTCSVTLRKDRMAIRVAGFISTEIPYEHIRDIETSHTRFWDGLGLRILSDGSVGYLVGGPAVRIHLYRTVVVSTSDPQKLIEEIQRRSLT